MPLCLTLGFKEPGRHAEPTVLYAGNDRDAARLALENPPAGFLRTSMVANPILNPNRSWPDNVASIEPEPVEEIPAVPELAAEEPAPAKPRK